MGTGSPTSVCVNLRGKSFWSQDGDEELFLDKEFSVVNPNVGPPSPCAHTSPPP